MTGQQETTSRAAGHAAGYCWTNNPRGRGTCTRPPGHSGDHVDYYNGRPSPADAAGYRWPQ